MKMARKYRIDQHSLVLILNGLNTRKREFGKIAAAVLHSYFLFQTPDNVPELT